MDKRSIDALLDSNFKRLRWRRMRLCYMPPAFVRDTDVSPLFLAHVARRPQGYYVLDGYLGIIFQSFERSYLAQHGVPKASGKPWNPIWLALHIANLEVVGDQRYLESETQVPSLCERIASVLEQLPHTMQDLRNALARKQILNHPLRAWSSAKPEKLEALVRYLSGAGN